MDIVIAGAHGKIGRQLTRLLHERGDRVRGLIRNPDQQDDIVADGGEPIVQDLEDTTPEALTAAIEGADAVVFAAGAGPGSGAERKATMDRDGAVLLLGAAQAAGVDRYVILSAMGTDDPPGGDDVFEVYLRAKADADSAVMASDRQWTVVRPGGLTDDEPTGRVRLGRHVDRGEVPRGDVAAVLATVLHDDRAIGHVVELVGGDTPIAEALADLTG